MDGVSVDFEFLGEICVGYIKEREYYHGPGLTKFEHRVRAKGASAARAALSAAAPATVSPADFIMLTSSSELLP